MHLQFSEHELKNDGMVTLAVTIEEELLRRMDATVQPDLAAEGRVEVSFKSSTRQTNHL